jgi:hypothetical protein
MIRNEKCEVLDKQNFEPKYRRVYDTSALKQHNFFLIICLSPESQEPTTKKLSGLGMAMHP